MILLRSSPRSLWRKKLAILLLPANLTATSVKFQETNHNLNAKRLWRPTLDQMADPISIISLLSTAGSLTKTILDYASSLKDAPNDLEDLSRELTSLHCVFEQLGDLVQSDDGGEMLRKLLRFSMLREYVIYPLPFEANKPSDPAIYQYIVITLEDLRTKLEKRSTAKGLRMVYNRLKWPIDRPDTQKFLRTIQRYIQMFNFALTGKGSRMLSQASGKVSEMLRASQQITQMQSETLQAIIALPDHTEIMAVLKQLRSLLHDDQYQRMGETQDFLRQLSTLDFTAMQKDSYSKRCANTGQWMLESPEFQTWLNSEDGQYSVLWCPGAPGAGKTVLTSIAINHVSETTSGRGSAIVYIYCDYANALTSSVGNLLGSMVRQLIEQTSHAGTIAELKKLLKQIAKNSNLTEEELSSWTEILSRNFDVVYTFVDALDECPEIGRNSLLARLQKYSVGNMRVFLTSRFNVDVTEEIPHAIRARISATSHDITTFVESKIHESRRLKSFTDRDPELKGYIINRIICQADGMFLLAGLQIGALGNQTSTKGVRSVLERLPTDIFPMYDLTIERICDQPKEEAELALKVLSTIFGATRPLEVDELRHALAIKPGDTDLNYEAFVDLGTLLSVTAGLVITYQDDEYNQEVFRLVHYTLQEYFKINQGRFFSDLEIDMARLCLTYLSLDEFASGQCDTSNLVAKRIGDFCFLHYAATNWAHHLRGVQTELMDQSLAFVQSSTKTSAWLEIFNFNAPCGMGLSSSEDLPIDPVFVAAHFHLSEMFTRLISSRDIDIRNSRGETPLLRAVDVRPLQKGGKPSFMEFRNAQTSQKSKDSPIIHALDSEQHAMVQVILDHNADIDAKDLLGLTATVRAVGNEDAGILSLLLDYGADIDVRSDDFGYVELGKFYLSLCGGESLLHIAASNERRVDIVQLLLDRGADVNVPNTFGKSPLHVAASHSTSAILDILIDYGALLDVTDEGGATPLIYAARNGRLETQTALIKRGARLDITDSMGNSPLHIAVLRPRPDVVEVVMRAQRVDVVDAKGRTPLHHAYFKSAQSSIDSFQEGNIEQRRIDFANVILQLIEGGASETIVDAYGRIPKDYLVWSTQKHSYQWSYCSFSHTRAEDDWHLNPHEDQTQDVNESEENSEDDAERGEIEQEGDQQNNGTNLDSTKSPKPQGSNVEMPGLEDGHIFEEQI